MPLKFQRKSPGRLGELAQTNLRLRLLKIEFTVHPLRNSCCRTYDIRWIRRS